MNISEVQKKANLVRKWCLVSTTEAGSGHATSCLSAADIATVLFDSFFSYDIKDPQNPLNDRFILSKGHAAPLLYTLFAMSGAFPIEELRTLRKFGSPLEGHPTPNFQFAEVGTGSLGQGLSIGVGMSFVLRAQVQNSTLRLRSGREFKIQNLPKVYVLLGDGEMAEGSVWEAANFASYYKLNNLIAILDVNRLGQSQETMFGHEVREYSTRFSAFDWEVLVIDGHDYKEIEKALNLAVNNKSKKPFAIIAKTVKGKGVSFLEDKDGWHGKAVPKEDLEKALAELGKADDGLRFVLKSPQDFARGPVKGAEVGTQNVFGSQLESVTKASGASANTKNFGASPRLKISYKLGDKVATREVYGEVLAQLADQNPNIYALDGDVKNSTFSQDFKKVYPERFIECFIAEQNMVGVALGLSKRGKVPFVSTFAAFFTRAFDQIRMAAISKGDIKFVGSHAGVSIGEDGPSQMGLEDFAMFGAIPNSIIFHPSDSLSCAKILPLMESYNGISYLRTLRPKTPVIYKNNEEFKIGGSKVLRSSSKDLLTVAVAGITVHEALKAYDELRKEGILIRVVDCYSIKPIDVKSLQQCSNKTIKQLIVTVEDHFEHGGLGDFVLSALSKDKVRVEKMAVYKISRSGTQTELLNDAGISARYIVERVKSLVKA